MQAPPALLPSGKQDDVPTPRTRTTTNSSKPATACGWAWTVEPPRIATLPALSPGGASTSPPAHVLAPGAGLRRYGLSDSLGQAALDLSSFSRHQRAREHAAKALGVEVSHVSLLLRVQPGCCRQRSKPKPRPLQPTRVQFKPNMRRLGALTSLRAARLIPDLEREERRVCPRLSVTRVCSCA